MTADRAHEFLHTEFINAGVLHADGACLDVRRTIRIEEWPQRQTLRRSHSQLKYSMLQLGSNAMLWRLSTLT